MPDEQIQDVAVMIATTTRDIIFGIFLNADFISAVAAIATLFLVIFLLVMFFPKIMK
jgi:hypothetical protein